MSNYQDGTGAFGIPADITINSVAYVIENVTPVFSTVTKQLMNKDGEVAKRRIISQPTEFTATLQLATDSTAVPTTAAVSSTTGTFTIPTEYGSGTAVITQVSPKYTQEEFTKVDISFYKKINA